MRYAYLEALFWTAIVLSVMVSGAVTIMLGGFWIIPGVVGTSSAWALVFALIKGEL
jgi:hypothetical protein